MVLATQGHVIATTDDPLDAIVEGTHYKAYLVANLAFNDGPEASAKHYKLTLGQVHSAIAFYYDNEDAIKRSKEEMRELGKKLGERDAAEHLAEIRARASKKE
jgi:uncharacterized protein (DUF433 family)